MRTYLIPLALPAHKVERFYAGEVNQVWARDVHGVSVRFPLTALQPYVTRDGVQGLFKLTVNAENRLESIERAPK